MPSAGYVRSGPPGADTDADPGPESRTSPRRRTLLGGLVAMGTTATTAGCQRSPTRTPAPSPAHGPGRTPAGHQRGIADPQPPHALLLSYDLCPGIHGPEGRRAVRRMLAAWTPMLGDLRADDRDRRTATVGVGSGLFARLGLHAPEALRELPAFAGDRLRPEAGGGDVCVQVCARTPDAVGELGRALERAASGVLRPRWRQVGFLPVTRPGETPRNLLGFKDGTANPSVAEAARWVWLGSGPYRGGTYLVVRRVRLATEEFGDLPIERQERIIGRHKAGGGPLQGGPEHAEADLFAKTPQGRYLLPADAHVRLAHPRFDGGARMLRRGYSYDNGPDDQGLLFLAYLNDPELFVRVQRRLAAHDALNPYIEHYGSAVFFVLPGASGKEVLGSTVL
ncbi:Dyp-type peroxidase [Streptomyces sp. CBMA152]|uniref:Dyp-type peroxidase n=1 Tax=Streptomyces sp. CBMA152 TaxID=1896312 RepID=UPI001CB73A06|nr:Dyp-type peroxidase [Streptomyces sp. CBMA152]